MLFCINHDSQGPHATAAQPGASSEPEMGPHATAAQPGASSEPEMGLPDNAFDGDDQSMELGVELEQDQQQFETETSPAGGRSMHTMQVNLV